MTTNNAINQNNSNLLDGQIEIGSTNGLTNFANITAGNGILIENGPNSITISNEASSVVLLPNEGGTGVSNPEIGVIVSNGDLIPMQSIPLTDGQILIGSTGASPIANTITAGAGITIENLPNEIIISNNSNDPSNLLLSSENLNDVQNKSQSRLNIYNTIQITSDISLDESAYGSNVIIRNRSITNYTITLPNASLSEYGYINIFADIPLRASLTIIGNANISGQSSIIMGSCDSITIMSNGSEYFIINQSLNPCGFLANLSSANIVPNTNTNLLFNNVSLNIGNGYNAISGTFTPPLPGVYKIHTFVSLNVTSGRYADFFLNLLNGSNTLITAESTILTASNVPAKLIDITTYMNTTSDLYRVSIRQGSNVTLPIYPDISYFGASRLSLF